MSIRLPRPTRIRNGGLLLVLVTLAAVMALVADRAGSSSRSAARRAGSGGTGVAGRRLPELQARTPAVTVEAPAVEAPRLRLG